MTAVLAAAALPWGTMPGEVQAAEAEKEWEYKEDTITMLIDTDTAIGGIQAVCDLAEEKFRAH